MPLAALREGRREIVVWMNQPSHYQTVFFRELASRPAVQLSVFYATGLAANRRSLGWEEPAGEAFEQTLLRRPFRLVKALRKAWRHRRGVHMVNGVWSVPVFVVCSSFLVLLGARVFFHSERPNPSSGRRGPWDMVKRTWVKMLFLRAEGIFVIGRRAGDYYRDLGVPAAKVIPFMYFNRGVGGLTAGLESGRPFTVIYVGQFIARKRVGDLIEAFARLKTEKPHARLLLVGSGPLRNSYEAQTAELGLSDSIEITGPLSPQDVALAIQRSDLLVLPSAFDGWGLTVNEALQAGVPAVCSDGCGAAELLEHRPDWGIVYPSGDVSELASALRYVAGDPERLRPLPAEVEVEIGPTALTTRFLRAVFGEIGEISPDPKDALNGGRRH